MTPQTHELLILDGQEVRMPFCPPLPHGHARIVETLDNDPERMRFNEWMHSPACVRQYRGVWEIVDDRFYLTGLEGKYKLLGSGKLLAVWFTGRLHIPRRDTLFFVHRELGQVWERERFIEIEKGMVVNSRIIDVNDVEWDEFQLGLRKHACSGTKCQIPEFVELPSGQDPPVCGHCGRSGIHPECREEMKRLRAGKRFSLRQFSIDGRFGPVSTDPEMTLEDAVYRLKEHLGHEPEFDVTEVIENRNWWLIPHGWIGMLGFIVEKHTGRIAELGSGWGELLAAIEAYEAGLIEPECPRADGP